MIGFLLRFRLIAFLIRIFFVPAVTILLSSMVFLIIGLSLYGLLIAKTAQRAVDNPYIFLPILLIELALLAYALVKFIGYINKVLNRNKKKEEPK